MPPANEANSGRHRAQDRIPTTLQAVFLASNRGHDVNIAPPDKAASKEYFKNNVFVRPSTSKILSVRTVFGEFNKKATVSSRQNNGLVFQRSNGKNQRSLPISLFSPGPLKAPIIKSESRVPTQITITKELSAADSVHAKSMPLNKVTNTSLSFRLKESPKSKSMSPHDFLVRELKERGFSTKTFPTLDTAYYIKPTPLQLASYDVYLIGLARAHQPEGLMEMIQCGLSPNPCNRYGESLLHTVSRFGNHVLLQVLLDQGCTVQVSDDYGRTPLHDALWAARPSFRTVELLLEQDPHLLFLLDARGHVPLDYVRKDDWETWVQFFRDRLDVYWSAPGNPEPSPLMTKQVLRLPLSDPENALPVEVAKLVASGRIKPEEAILLVSELDDESDYSGSSGDDSSSYDDDSEGDSVTEESSIQSGGDNSLEEYEELINDLNGSWTKSRVSTAANATCV